MRFRKIIMILSPNDCMLLRSVQYRFEIVQLNHRRPRLYLPAPAWAFLIRKAQAGEGK
jgi:hypothetical protein